MPSAVKIALTKSFRYCTLSCGAEMTNHPNHPSKLMRIAMVDPSLFTWQYDKALIEGLLANGHQVILYTKHLSVAEKSRKLPFVTEIFYLGFNSKFINRLPKKVALALKGFSHALSMVVLYTRLRSAKPDIIHFQWVPLPLVDRFVVPLFRNIAPIVLTVHDSSPFNGNPTSKIQSVGAVGIWRRFDKLIVHTRVAASRVKDLGIDDTKIEQIAHGKLSLQIRPAKRQRLNFNKKLTILFFGHLKPYKGLDILIQAIFKLPEHCKDGINVKIVGKPEMDMEPLLELTKKNRLDKVISWELRYLTEHEVVEQFANADIAVMPYRMIDASGVLMLAIAAGLPVVATNIGLFAELIKDGEHGLLVPVDDADALSCALMELIENNDLRQTMVSNVCRLETSIPSWAEIACKTDLCYRTLETSSVNHTD